MEDNTFGIEVVGSRLTSVRRIYKSTESINVVDDILVNGGFAVRVVT